MKTDAERFLDNPDLTPADIPNTTTLVNAGGLSEHTFGDGSVAHETDYGFWDIGPQGELPCT